jgi:DNA-binding MarR family transcriptional regulator
MRNVPSNSTRTGSTFTIINHDGRKTEITAEFIAYMKLNFTVCLHIMNQDQINAASTELLLSVGLLARRARAASSSHELSWTQRAVMGRLAKEGPATISDLARAESMKPQSMGATVTALEELGLVERRPHPTDGRQVNIALTEKGARVREENRAAKMNWLAQAISQLNEEEQETLFKAGDVIKRLGAM